MSALAEVVAAMEPPGSSPPGRRPRAGPLRVAGGRRGPPVRAGGGLRGLSPALRRAAGLRGMDADLRLLAGDALYALGLARLAEQRRPGRGGGAVGPDLAHRPGAGRGHARAGGGALAGHRRGLSERADRAPWPLGAIGLPRRPRDTRSHVDSIVAVGVEWTSALAPWPPIPPRNEPRKSRYTEDRGMAGAFEGETVTRRGLMTGGGQAAGGIAAAAFVLPALGFALGPMFEDGTPDTWQDVGPRGTSTTRSTSQGDEHRRRDRRGRQDHGLHAQVQPQARRPSPSDEENDKKPQPYVAISTRCAHLGCPVRYIQASQRFVCPCHGGVYDFEGKVAGGPPVRPLDRFYTRVRQRPRRGGRPLLRELRAAPLQPARPVQPPGRAVAVPLPVEAEHMSKLVPPLPKFLRPAPPKPGQKQKNGGAMAATATATASRASSTS